MEDNSLKNVNGEQPIDKRSVQDELKETQDETNESNAKTETIHSENISYANDENDRKKKLKPSSDNKSVIIGILLMFLFLILFSSLIYFVDSEKNKVSNGTIIVITDKIHESLGNLTYEQAVERANKIIDEYLDSNLSLSDSSKTVTIKLKDIGVSINTDSAKNAIKESLYTPYIIDSIERHYRYNRTIPLITDVKLDTAKLEIFINSQLKYIEKNPENADLFVNKKGEVEIKAETLGCTLDKDKLIDSILSTAKQYGTDIKTPTKVVTPSLTQITIKDLMPTKLMSSFSTYYGGSDYGRKVNVELGTSLINDALLKPGEEFEYWKYVGETTLERGFKLAGVYINGKLAIDIGGGLCQVSTTLYNAALLADTEITERSPHGLPVYYVPLGLDATVSIGDYTLRFKNNTNKYMLVKSSYDGGTLTFSIYGDMPEGKTVKVYANSLGAKVADSYRDVYMNGKLVRHDYLGRDYYK